MTAISTQPIADPAPGIYPNVPAEVYHRRWRGVSHSALVQFAKSPRHYRAWKDEPQEPTPGMELGSAFHMLTLEPDPIPAALRERW